MTDLSTQELLLRIPVDVVREGDWHAVDERENAVEVAGLLVVTLQPGHLFCGEARLLADGVVRRRVLGNDEGDRAILVVRVLLRSLFVVVVLDVVVSEDRGGAGERLRLEDFEVLRDAASPLPLVLADTAFLPDDVARIRQMFAFATQDRMSNTRARGCQLPTRVGTAGDVVADPAAWHCRGQSVQEPVVVLAEAARAKLCLHLAEPLVFAALDLDEFGDALDSRFGAAPEQGLTMRDGRCGLILPAGFDIFRWNACQEAAVRWR